MIKIIKKVIRTVIGEEPISISEIEDLGIVNNVYDVNCHNNSYIVRLNRNEDKRLEFIKEEWCINQVRELGVPTPKVYYNGICDGYPIMIQEKIEGSNGSKCKQNEKIKIWEALGKYVLKYNKIKEIEIPELIASEFHDNWRSKLEYNIEQLDSLDSLLVHKTFTKKEHDNIRRALVSMREEEYELGLTHGDLCPRNTIVNDRSIFLLDWGTAEINVIPYGEIGMILIEGETNEAEFHSFLEGMEIDRKKYGELELGIWKLNILHVLDKYRWASSYDLENLKNYQEKLKQVYGTA